MIGLAGINGPKVSRTRASVDGRDRLELGGCLYTGSVNNAGRLRLGWALHGIDSLSRYRDESS